MIRRIFFNKGVDPNDKQQWSAFLKSLDNELSSIVREVNNIASGPTSTRPPAANVQKGTPFFDTTLGYNIWSNGINWVNASGAVV